MFFGKRREESGKRGPAAGSDGPANAESRVIGYYYSVTGIFGYEFYSGEEKLCDVYGDVLPSSSVSIRAHGIQWESDFDDEVPIVPGCERFIDDDIWKGIHRLVYMGGGQYRIDNSVEVRCTADDFAFFREDQQIARIRRFSGRAAFIPRQEGCDFEPYFEVVVRNGLDRELQMLIFAFPMLRFAR